MFNRSECCGNKSLSLRSWQKAGSGNFKLSLKNHRHGQPAEIWCCSSSSIFFFFVRTHVVFWRQEVDKQQRRRLLSVENTPSLYSKTSWASFSLNTAVLCGWQGGSTLRPVPPLVQYRSPDAFCWPAQLAVKQKQIVLDEERQKVCKLCFFFFIWWEFPFANVHPGCSPCWICQIISTNLGTVVMVHCVHVRRLDWWTRGP